MAALKENPPIKSFIEDVVDKEGVWWIAKLKPRQEKAFAFDLLRNGIDFCLPMISKKAKKKGGGYRKSQLVLFPSYVPFVSNSPYLLLDSPRVSTIIKVPSQVRFRKELSDVYTVLGLLDDCVTVSKVEYLPGDNIEILGGPLAGKVGKVQKVGNNGDIYVNVNGLGATLINVMGSCVQKSVAV